MLVTEINNLIICRFNVLIFTSLSHIIIQSLPPIPLPALHTLTFLISTTYLVLTWHSEGEDGNLCFSNLRIVKKWKHSLPKRTLLHWNRLQKPQGNHPVKSVLCWCWASSKHSWPALHQSRLKQVTATTKTWMQSLRPADQGRSSSTFIQHGQRRHSGSVRPNKCMFF